MFEIEYKGANCVVITTKKSKIVLDPNISQFGLKNPSTSGIIQIATESRFVLNGDESELLIDGPGEYGVKEFDIKGIAARRHIDQESDTKKSTLYRIEVDGIRVGIIGNIDKKLSEDQLEGLGLLDVLILPVGGNGYTLDSVSASGIVGLIEPKVVIPIHFANNSIKYEVPQDEIDLFVKELGIDKEVQSKYKLKSVSNLPEKMTIVELELS